MKGLSGDFLELCSLSYLNQFFGIDTFSRGESEFKHNVLDDFISGKKKMYDRVLYSLRGLANTDSSSILI